MREVRRTIHIDAPRLDVWKVLTDFDAYPEWSSFLQAQGRPEEGSRLRVHIRLPGGRGLKIRPRVLRADEGVELRWHGRLWPGGLFGGEHWFRLEKDGDGTWFDHGEVFRGLLVRPVWKGLEGGTVAGFETFNRELRGRVEKGRGGG